MRHIAGFKGFDIHRACDDANSGNPVIESTGQVKCEPSTVGIAQGIHPVQIHIVFSTHFVNQCIDKTNVIVRIGERKRQISRSNHLPVGRTPIIRVGQGIGIQEDKLIRISQGTHVSHSQLLIGIAAPAVEVQDNRSSDSLIVSLRNVF